MHPPPRADHGDWASTRVDARHLLGVIREGSRDNRVIELRRRMPPADGPVPGGGSTRCSGRRPSRQGRCQDAHVRAGAQRGREHAIVTAEEVPRRRARPILEWPRLLQRLRVLPPFPSPRLVRHLGRNVVVEDVVVTAPLVARIRPPLCEELAWRGIIAATRTRSSTGTRAQTSGAVKPPSECPTTTRSLRSPTAWTTVSTYSDQPADASSLGRSTATGSCPCSRSSGATRCQSHELPPPPCMSTNVATKRTPQNAPVVW